MAIDNPHWFDEVIQWLIALPRDHSIEQITFSCSLTVQHADSPDQLRHEIHGWHELQAQLDRIPSLGEVRMHLDAVVQQGYAYYYGDGGDSEMARIATEERAEFMRTVWNHPRCTISVVGP